MAGAVRHSKCRGCGGLFPAGALVSVWLLGLVGLELIFWYNFNLDLVWPWLLIMILILILWLIMVFRKNEVEKS